MLSKARIGTLPVHPMLVPIPAGAFVITPILNVVYIIPGSQLWWQATLPLTLVGVIDA